MFKRVIWMGMGAAAGSAATVWSQRKVKAQVEQIQQMATPAHVIDVAKSKANEVKDRVVNAVNDGIAETRQIEAELRAGLPGSAATPLEDDELAVPVFDPAAAHHPRRSAPRPRQPRK